MLKRTSAWILNWHPQNCRRCAGATETRPWTLSSLLNYICQHTCEAIFQRQKKNRSRVWKKILMFNTDKNQPLEEHLTWCLVIRHLQCGLAWSGVYISPQFMVYREVFIFKRHLLSVGARLETHHFCSLCSDLNLSHGSHWARRMSDYLDCPSCNRCLCPLYA